MGKMLHNKRHQSDTTEFKQMGGRIEVSMMIYFDFLFTNAPFQWSARENADGAKR